jgi:K+-sensing histidine kinase KdpD
MSPLGHHDAGSQKILACARPTCLAPGMQWSPRVPRLSDVLRHPLGGYAIAIGATGVMTVVMLALRPFVHPFVSPPFLFVVLIVARRLGFGPAVAAAAVSVVAFAVLFVTPTDPVITDEAEVAATVVLLAALVIAWLLATVRSGDERAPRLMLEVAARSDALDADRAKDERLAILAYELRRQLTATRAALLAMDAAPHDHESAARTRAIILHQTDQLARFVDDLLERTRAGSGASSSTGSRAAPEG